MTQFDHFGVGALRITVDEKPGVILCRKIAALGTSIKLDLGEICTDIVFGWDTILVHYDPTVLSPDEIQMRLRRVVPALTQSPGPAVERSVLHQVPVWYNGIDLQEVADSCRLEVAEVISLHCGREYLVGTIGFAPGQAYLGFLHKQLNVARRDTPRTRVPAGSVAIAGGQSTVYPSDLPGGWNILGTSTWQPFDAMRQPPCLIKVGDRVRFTVVEEAEFNEMKAKPKALIEP